MEQRSNLSQNEAFSRRVKAGVWKELHAGKLLTDGQLERLLQHLESEPLGTEE